MKATNEENLKLRTKLSDLEKTHEELLKKVSTENLLADRKLKCVCFMKF